MTSVKSGLMIIDQHRAHVRILYERYLQQFEKQSSLSQSVAFPDVVQFSAADTVKLQTVLPEMEQMGFELTDLGAGSYSITAVPVGLDGLNLVKLVEEMVSTALSEGTSVVEDINKSLALTLARNAAIPAGQALSNKEMENIVDKLFTCSNVNYTPDGKTILCILRQQEIEHLFG